MTANTEKDITSALESKIDRTKWEKWRFSDLVDNIVEKVVPKDSGLEHYIGLEHLDSGSLHIKRFGETSSLIGDKLRIYKGDLIFAKRNAYLKRVAVAKFDAVASAHSMVLRPKPENILPEFLPFFLLSEKFWQRAIEISVGSLSPTINWKAIAKQEFLLPPKDQQAPLAELLWAMDEVVERERSLYSKLKQLIIVNTKNEFDKKHKVYTSLQDSGTWISGGTPSRQQNEFWGGDIPWVSPKDMKFENIDNSIEKITVRALESGAKLLPENSLLIVVRGLILAHSFPVAKTTNNVSFNQDIKALIVSEEFEPDYLLFFLQSQKDKVLAMTTTTTHGTKRLSSEVLYSLPVPKPPINEQIKFTEFISMQKKALSQIKILENQSKALQKSLLNQIFS